MEASQVRCKCVAEVVAVGAATAAQASAFVTCGAAFLSLVSHWNILQVVRALVELLW